MEGQLRDNVIMVDTAKAIRRFLHGGLRNQPVLKPRVFYAPRQTTETARCGTLDVRSQVYAVWFDCYIAVEGSVKEEK
jgi:hypothetical protein